MSDSEILYEPDSVLDLSLSGSVGSFKVGVKSSSDSIEVKYFLTHVGLNFSEGPDEKLLRELAPVREIFDPQDLNFDEIMQRDIDDARVSNELIPYILDAHTKDLVKFFPPIIVMVLPVEENRNNPAPYYPKVFSGNERLNRKGVDEWMITRSGDVGGEVFEFNQPILNGKADCHNAVTLKLNTSKCRLVIVDGQHRAMALLALYRNMKSQWAPSNRKPFEKYYKEWTPDYIEKFNLSLINLPMVVCTVPTLDSEYRGDYNLKKASRSIFLTLNKSARIVSRTRTILLDDNDLISSFMRKTLGNIKDMNFRSASELTIENIQLDQHKQKLNSPIAISGVSHIYYIVEHLLMRNGNDVMGVSGRRGNFTTRTHFATGHSRLMTKDMLGQEACAITKRDLFSDKVESELCDEYDEVYGKWIVYFLSKFRPYEYHNKASYSLRGKLKEDDVDLDSMLFGGQGALNAFEDHRSNLKKKLKEEYSNVTVPRIKTLVEQMDSIEVRKNARVKELREKRANLYISESRDKSPFKSSSTEVSSEIVKLINEIFDSVFTTVAFQSAIVCGFFNEFEKVSDRFDGNEELNLSDEFIEYLDQISIYFTPTSFSSFKNIISLLLGRTEGTCADELRVSHNSNDSFRGVVYPGEMTPDQWPTYRYLLLEVWNPSNEVLGNQISSELKYCREQVFKKLYERKKGNIAKTKNITVDDFSEEDYEFAFDESFKDYKQFLSHFKKSSEITEKLCKTIIHTPNDVSDE